MAVSTLSCSYFGVESYIVEVEVDVSNGLPVFNIVGMGDLAITESKERIRSCFKNIDLVFPVKRVLINLSPADIKKKGSHFDLPIFVGILANIGKITNIEKLAKYLILGEISLNGSIKDIKGAINAAILAKEKNLKGIIVPKGNYNESRLINGLEVVPVENISEVIKFLNDEITVEKLLEKIVIEKEKIENKEYDNLDFSEVKGQLLAKRAMEIAAAGGHNLFLMGDPGSGKSMMAKRFNTIMPDMTDEEIIETTKIYSVSGMLSKDNPIVNKRPFRSPHHTATQVALVGGANRVGEITLALNGVFFLDELGEFGVKTLETLRQPLEDGKVVVSRANVTYEYPVKGITIMASNPTPSGYFPEDEMCKDSLRDIKNYQKRFSGPILDRIDLYVEMKRLNNDEIFGNQEGESSKSIKSRVMKARKIQYERYKQYKLNSQMTKKDLKKYCVVTKEIQDIIELAMNQMKLSVRMYDKILKISRTIADIEESKEISVEHVLEALNYRKK